MSRPIFLIGYMCSGKTTLGRALSHATGRPYIDLDEFIEREQAMSVAAIFACLGETAFRDMESDALSRVAEMDDVIIGCGGGTPCRLANMELMNRSGLTVHLRASLDRLLSRLLLYRDKRPLLRGLTDTEIEAEMHRGLAIREEAYSAAAMEFDSSRLETEDEIAETVGRFINTIIINQ